MSSLILTVALALGFLYLGWVGVFRLLHTSLFKKEEENNTT